MTRPGRHVVVVEIVTSGPDPRRHQIIELAGVDVESGDRVDGVWPLDSVAYARADLDYLRVANYDRPPSGELGAMDQELVVTALTRLLRGHTLGATDPVWVAAFLVQLFKRHNVSAGWHSRFADLGALAAGAHGMAATELPTLAATCALLDVPPPESRSAAAAAQAAAHCFQVLSRSTADGGRRRHLRAVPEES